MNIFVAKLNYQTQENELKELFENFGTVDSVKIIWDREKQQSKGFGFVEMPVEDEARNAIGQLNDTEFGGRQIVVKESIPR
ncbi:MAG: RNA-binding protein [Flavobacteriales bacterium]|nr:RNA-binding protein [Flavobacteriales bacterium]